MRHSLPAIILASALALPVLPAMAQQAGATATGDGKIRITADKFVVAQDNDKATFSGNVHVVSSSVDVKAPTIVVHYAKGNTSDITSMDATGGVTLKTADETATGDRATYDPKTRIMNLLGNVVVTNKSGTLHGPRLEINLNTNVSTFTSGGGGRVTGVFESQ